MLWWPDDCTMGFYDSTSYCISTVKHLKLYIKRKKKMLWIIFYSSRTSPFFFFNTWQDGDSSTVSYKHVSAPRNTLSIFRLNQSDCGPTEVIRTFITFPRVSFLSELVSFHSHLHRCWRIWIIHAICVIYVFAYSWRHKCVCVRVCVSSPPLKR